MFYGRTLRIECVCSGCGCGRGGTLRQILEIGGVSAPCLDHAVRCLRWILHCALCGSSHGVLHKTVLTSPHTPMHTRSAAPPPPPPTPRWRRGTSCAPSGSCCWRHARGVTTWCVCVGWGGGGGGMGGVWGVGRRWRGEYGEGGEGEGEHHIMVRDDP